MPNAIYPLYKAAILQSAANSNMATGVVKVALVDTGVYAYNPAHDFLDVVPGRVGTDQTLTAKTFAGGVFDAADVTFPAVSGVSVEALLIYIDTGVAATSRLIAHIDTGVAGLPVTPTGADIVVVWNAQGIFAL